MQCPTTTKIIPIPLTISNVNERLINLYSTIIYFLSPWSVIRNKIMTSKPTCYSGNGNYFPIIHLTYFMFNRFVNIIQKEIVSKNTDV